MNKSFNDQKYKVTVHVLVVWADGDAIEDEIKGLNTGHALYLAHLNWPTAKTINVRDHRNV